MAVLSEASGSLSGASASVTIPANTRRMTLFVKGATLSAAANISIALRQSSTAKAFTGIRDVNNGGTMEANWGVSVVAIFGSTAAGETAGFFVVADFIDSASVRTMTSSYSMRTDEKGIEAHMLADTAQIEDEAIISTSGATFTAGDYRAVFEDASG